MGLEIRKTSKWWYGRWMENGVRSCAKLNVPIEGKPGDAAFERSREAAQDALDKLIAGVKEQKRPEDMVQEIHRVRFGHRIGSIPLASLFEVWKDIPRKRQPKDQYIQWTSGIFLRFQTFVKSAFPQVKEMAAVDRKVAESFMRSEQARGVSPKTYNAELILLRGAFENLREDAGMLANPFGRIVSKDRDTVHRQPFTAEELRAIVDVVENDPLMRPLVIVGICTAMRRGDACLLKWNAVDLDNGFVTVKTSKTGETVEIPLLAMLREELMRQPKAKSGYVFPELAQMYLTNQNGINWRLHKVFETAGFINEEEVTRRNIGRKRAGWAPLDIERRGDNQAERQKGAGLRTANVRGFHSFRVTWITIALTAGVPMELVRRVTGHTTADVVLKHYFRPGREDFKRTLENAMPRLFMEPSRPKALPPGSVKVEKNPKTELLNICQGMTAKSRKKDMERIAALLEGL
jgi:integrase